LLYSVRSPDALLFAGELAAGGRVGAADQAIVVYSRQAPSGDLRRPGRLDAADVANHVLAVEDRPMCFVCGPTPFVEAVNELLRRAGHDLRQIRAERFGTGRT